MWIGGLWKPWSLNGLVAEALAYHSDFMMNDNDGTTPQQIAHLEGIASKMRDNLGEARADPSSRSAVSPTAKMPL